MNQIARSFIFVALIVAILLALHFLPKITIGETELRRVNVLSDILPESMENGDGLGYIPDVPEPPKPIVVTTPVAPAAPADSQQTARPAAPQNDFHAVFQQFPRHGQGLFHGGKTYLHPHAATLGILPDGLGYGAGIGNKGEAKRMLGHEASRGCCSRDNAG